MVELKIVSKNADPEPLKVLEKLIKEEKIEITAGKIEEIKQNDLKPNEGDSQSLAIMLFLEIRKNGLSKDWQWVRGINKKESKTLFFHSWLEYKDWAIDPMPGFKIDNESVLPGSILIMDRAEYKKKTGFTIMSRKKEKQVLRWIEKNNKKHGA